MLPAAAASVAAAPSCGAASCSAAAIAGPSSMPAQRRALSARAAPASPPPPPRSAASTPVARPRRRRRQGLVAALPAALLVASVLVVGPLSLLPRAAAVPAPRDAAHALPGAAAAGAFSAAPADQLVWNGALSSAENSSPRDVLREPPDRARAALADGSGGADALLYHAGAQVVMEGGRRIISLGGDAWPLVQGDASIPPPVGEPHPPPTRTHQRRALFATSSNGRTYLPSAFPSQLASSWQPADRSVWFQKKAVIITSIFLAIFIVLCIGAAVFLRDRADDDEDLYDEDMDADELAIERMREERLMRSAGRGPQDGGEGLSEEKRSWRRRRKAAKADRAHKLEKEESFGSKDRASGNSSALRHGRTVARWVRAPVQRLGARRRSDTTTEGAEADDEHDARSVHTGGAPRRRVRSGVYPRLGDGEERVEVQYDNASPTSEHSAPLEAAAADSPPQLPGAEAPTSSDASAAAATAARPAGQPSASRALDDSDFDAAEAAEAGALEGLPPAYIPGRSSVSGPSGAVIRPLAGSAEPPPPPMLDPALAGRGAVPDAKRADGAIVSAVPSSSARPDAEIIGALLDADADPFAASSGSRLSSDTRTPAQRYAAHVATDDKTLLSAMRAAASAPSPSAPGYSGSAAGTSGDETTDDGPSAPSLEGVLGSTDGTEDLAGTPLPTSEYHDVPREKGKGSQLPPPPPRASPTPAPFSRFDEPYARSEWAPSALRVLDSPSAPLFERSMPDGSVGSATAPLLPSSAAPDLVAPPAPDAGAARRAEKRREAEAEAALVASSPADFAAQALPAYERGEQRRASTSHTVALPPLTPAAASAPDAQLLEEEEARHVQSLSNAAHADAPSTSTSASLPPPGADASAPAPSAPPLDLDP